MATARNRRPLAKVPSRVQVHSRLFAADVAAIKAAARAEDLPWQALLRRLVHRAVKAKQVVA